MYTKEVENLNDFVLPCCVQEDGTHDSKVAAWHSGVSMESSQFQQKTLCLFKNYYVKVMHWTYFRKSIRLVNFLANQALLSLNLINLLDQSVSVISKLCSSNGKMSRTDLINDLLLLKLNRIFF